MVKISAGNLLEIISVNLLNTISLDFYILLIARCFQSEKLVRKQARREKIERQHHEISRLRTMLRLNTVLAGLSHDSVKSDFLTGERGAAVSVTRSL